MIQRKRHVSLLSYPPKQNDQGQFLCLNCDGIVSRPRAKKYCSRECGDQFFTKNNHGRLRAKLIKLCKRICSHCAKRHRKSHLILDHKIPIALGGSEFDETNLQILCVECNRSKTREDHARISQARKAMVIQL